MVKNSARKNGSHAQWGAGVVSRLGFCYADGVKEGDNDGTGRSEKTGNVRRR
jgi:hypothetical protein